MYSIDTGKAAPKREEITIQLEEEIIRYNQDGDHCKEESPVLQKGSKMCKIFRCAEEWGGETC